MPSIETVDILFLDDDDSCLAPLAEALFAKETHSRILGSHEASFLSWFIWYFTYRPTGAE